MMEWGVGGVVMYCNKRLYGAVKRIEQARIAARGIWTNFRW